MRIFLFLLALLVYPTSSKADKHFTVAGGGSGTSWSDPATFSAAALAARGTTNWIAAGTYSGFTFSQAQSGSTYAIIKKATVTTHGTATGWTDSMGAQSVFGEITVNKPFLLMDGSERTESFIWTAPTGYGFKVSKVSADSSNGDDADYSIFAYCDIGYPYTLTYNTAMYESVRIVYNQIGLQFIRCAMHSARRAMIQGAGASDLVIDQCHFGPSWGKEAIRGGNQNFSSGWTISNSRFWNAANYNPDDVGAGITAEIGIWDWSTNLTASGYKIYGNWFYNSAISGRNSVIVVGGGGDWRGGPADGTVVYNNTIAGIADDPGYPAIQLNGSSTVSKNNLFYDVPGNSNTTNSSATVKANNILATSDPFVNYAGRDYRINSGSQAHEAGTTISGAEYGTDPLGTARGQGAAWDVGAYEYYDTAPSPPVITSILQALITNGISTSYTITASGTPTNYTATPLPLGLSLSGSVISGTPSGIVSYTTNTTIQAINGAGSDSETLVWSVYNGLPPTFTTSPVAKTNSEATGIVLTSVATTTYGSVSYQWQSNNINIGGATSASYSKVPATSGTDSGFYRVIAGNSWGSVTSSAVYVSITNATLIPTITPTDISGIVNQAITSYQIVASEGPTNYGATSLPGNLSLDAASGIISGTVTNAGTNLLTLAATNSIGGTVTNIYVRIASLVSTNISVGSRVAVNISPTLRVRDAAALAGNILGEQNYEAQGTVTDGPVTADGYTWWEIDYDTAPDGWSIEGSGGSYWLIVTPDGDTTPPTIVITGPSGTGSYATNTQYFTLNGTASDNIGLSEVSVAGFWTEAQVATGTTSWSLDVQTPLASGEYVFDAIATDTSSNKSTNQITITLTLPIPPRVAIGTRINLP